MVYVVLVRLMAREAVVTGAWTVADVCTNEGDAKAAAAFAARQPLVALVKVLALAGSVFPVEG